MAQRLTSTDRRIFNPILMILLIGCIMAALTVLLYPTSRTFELVSFKDFGKVIMSRKDVILSPIFGDKSEKLYSIQLETAEPELRKYAASHPELGKLSIVSKFNIYADGTRGNETSFSWRYWILFILMPSIVLGIVISIITPKLRQ